MQSPSLGLGKLEKDMGGIPPGSNIVLFGPPGVGKATLLRHIILNFVKDGGTGILVTTQATGREELGFFESHEAPLERVYIVDTVSPMLVEHTEESEHVKLVPSPADITVIGVKVAQIIEKVGKPQGTLMLGVNSLSTLLMYANPQIIYRFMHSMTSRIRSSRMLGVYVLEESMHPVEITTMIHHLCNVHIRMKRDEDGTLKVQAIRAPFTQTKEYEMREKNGEVVFHG